MADDAAKDQGNEAGDRDGAEGASGAERLTAPPDESRRPRLAFPVVGIGASAGGLEAFTEFLQSCPADAGMAYVLVQHLPPDRESLLADLLARQTDMPVVEVIDGQEVEPDRVYVIRPGHTLTVKDGRLRLGPELAARGHGRPVDDFFRSLAEEQQQRAIAVVFSGMGSNGTAGAQAVKAVGGLVIAQEPESARYPAMPRSLIDAHLPDYILRPAEVPEALARYAAQPYAANADAGAESDVREDQALSDVLAVLRTRTRHDFAGYRKPTLLRQVRRRMGLGQFGSMADYVRALRQTPAEVAALADDLLIHVTGFFRDPEAWEVLLEKVITPLAVDRPDGAEVRCWVAACATGEEAYSLAMLLVEAAEARGKRFDVKVFATDMAERALGAARAGVGIESEVTPERLARFFDKDDSFYRVRKELRELVIFAPQNMLQDPPFSRLDVATCRNLLIYLEPETQRRVLALLHFGLREGGALMLGSSESAASVDGDFEPIDKRYRIFRRVGPTRPGTLDVPSLVTAAREGRPALTPVPGRPGVPTPAQLVGRTLLDRHTPAAVAVDSAGLIVHVHGDTSRFLALPSGSPSLDLMAMANDQVRGALRAALHRASDLQAPAAVRDGLIETPEGRRRVEVEAAPLGPRGAQPLYLVTFRDYPEPPPPPPGDPSSAERLADDLQRTRNELQGALEEMQSSNEELKAAHEEATSLNEELQSTNEELETSKEEMQSLNEELVTVNAQLQAKMVELEATANDLGSLLTSTDIAVLFLDPKFRIRRFTPAVRDLLDLIPSDVGRPFVDLRLKFADPQLLADAQAVLDRLVPIERAVESESGRSYLRRVLPYRTQDDRIDGVVVAFVDVSQQRKADEALRESEGRLSALVRAGGNAVYRMTPDWRRMLTLEGFGFVPDTIRPSESWLDRYIPAEDRPTVLAATARAIREKAPFELEHRVYRADGTVGWTYSRAVPLLDARGDITEWFGSAGDVTDRMRAQEALRRSEEQYRVLFESIDEGLCLVEVLYEAGRPVDYLFLEVNPAFERHTGIAGGTGRRMREISPRHEAHWFEVYGRVVETGEPERFQQEAASLGRYFDVCAFRVGLAEQRRVAVLFTDITGRRQAEERQAFLLKLVDSLRPLADPAAIQDDACRLLGERIGADRAYYVELDEARGEATVRRDFVRGDSPSLSGRHRTADFGWVVPAMRRGETIVVPDVASSDLVPPADRPAIEAVRIAAHVNVPLVKGGTLVGAVCVTESAPRAWTEAEVELVRETAERIWEVTERARAEAALRESEGRLRVALSAARMGTWTWDVAVDVHRRDSNLNALLGLPAEETVRPFDDFLAHMHQDDREATRAAFEQAARGVRPLNIEFRIILPEGSIRWLRDQGDVLGEAEDAARRLAGACVDVTDLKEAEAALRRANEGLEARVAERTSELAAVLGSLESEMTRHRDLARRLATAQEDERRRVSRDLHDSAGQLLAGLSLAAKAAQTAGAEGRPAGAPLADVLRLSDEIGGELHALAVRLRPTALDDVGLVAALEQLIAVWSGRTGLRADLQATGFGPGRLAPEVETAVYRIVQEALTNVAKHANASAVGVVVGLSGDHVTAIVEDDGVGFNPDAPTGRLGLVGMRERAALVGGELSVESAPGSGTVVRARIPASEGGEG